MRSASPSPFWRKTRVFSLRAFASAARPGDAARENAASGAASSAGGVPRGDGNRRVPAHGFPCRAGANSRKLK
jgi:hypothetical protein